MVLEHLLNGREQSLTGGERGGGSERERESQQRRKSKSERGGCRERERERENGPPAAVGGVGYPPGSHVASQPAL